MIFLPHLTGGIQVTACHDEYSCLAATLSEPERLNLEAIRTLHSKLDDDANGNIDLSESDEVHSQLFDTHCFVGLVDRMPQNLDRLDLVC